MIDDLKQKIKKVAVDHFDRDGYHGTTIRNIARDVGCSLPMVYYYYQSKNALFYEIIKEDYFQVLKKIAAGLHADDAIEYYTQLVIRINDIDDYERKIYRLGLKVYLGFDGDETLKSVMDQWEQSIQSRHYKRLMSRLSGRSNPEAVVRTLVHLLENLIERIVVKGQRLSEREVREELEVIISRS